MTPSSGPLIPPWTRARDDSGEDGLRVPCTHPGRVRANNEDAVAVDPHAQLAVLADGMGGYNAGEVASGMATTFIRTELARWLAQAGQHLKAFDLRRGIEICVDNANHAILRSE